MRIRVEYNAYPFRKITGREGEEIVVDDPIDVRQLLSILENRYGGGFSPAEYERKANRLGTIMLVDGIGVKKLDQRLEDGSMVRFLMLASGG